MAKAYDSKSGDTGATEGGPTKSSESPLGKFIPFIVGFIVLAMVIGLVIRSNSTKPLVKGSDAPSAGQTTGTNPGSGDAVSGAGASGPAARPNGTFPATR